MKKIILPLAFVAVLFSCKNTQKKEVTNTKKNTETVAKQPSISSTTKQEFTGDDDNNYVVTYTFEKNQPVAKLECDGYTETLSQTKAWAKGGEYEKGDYKLISKGDNVILFVKDKEIKFALK